MHKALTRPFAANLAPSLAEEYAQRIRSVQRLLGCNLKYLECTRTPSLFRLFLVYLLFFMCTIFSQVKDNYLR